jgi:hypothetical protein
MQCHLGSKHLYWQQLVTEDATIPTANRITFTDLTVAGWFKTGTQNDKLLEFTAIPAGVVSEYPPSSLVAATAYQGANFEWRP